MIKALKKLAIQGTILYIQPTYNKLFLFLKELLFLRGQLFARDISHQMRK
jgi:hypothetical protein